MRRPRGVQWSRRPGSGARRRDGSERGARARGRGRRRRVDPQLLWARGRGCRECSGIVCRARTRPRVMPRPDDPKPEKPRPRDRSWSTRLAWLVLVGGAGIVVARLSFATVVQLHGDGMAPTLLDGDHVLLVRGQWTIERGDVIVYDPRPPLVVPAPAPPAPE